MAACTPRHPRTAGHVQPHRPWHRPGLSCLNSRTTTEPEGLGAGDRLGARGHGDVQGCLLPGGGRCRGAEHRDVAEHTRHAYEGAGGPARLLARLGEDAVQDPRAQHPTANALDSSLRRVRRPRLCASGVEGEGDEKTAGGRDGDQAAPHAYHARPAVPSLLKRLGRDEGLGQLGEEQRGGEGHETVAPGTQTRLRSVVALSRAVVVHDAEHERLGDGVQHAAAPESNRRRGGDRSPRADEARE
mmetsp:Transcript_51791/g.171599  ORF Transcript_51791/g.171599 Transcript_51791/m.171599 type:complete len:244 (+) Transcript_51791:57-788(+)